MKHEVVVLRVRSERVGEKIKELSREWPKRKQFIEGAYKILLFTKNQRRQVTLTMNELSKMGLMKGFDFKEALNRVLKKWYEQRIKEETDRNQRLRILHEGLTKVKSLRELFNAKKKELEMVERLILLT